VQTFYSNGKLLITGEYLVLDGAEAFALPTKFGQYLHIEATTDSKISWTSIDADGAVWFEDIIPFETIINNAQSEEFDNVKNTLIGILYEAFKLNPSFLNVSNGYSITTKLTFPRNWGLGTSSTLINNIAQWLQIDAFALLKNSFGGSGYDVACAQNNSPIIYQLQNDLPVITPVAFTPDFSDKIFFVYLNQKQNSRRAIANYYNKQFDVLNAITVITTITHDVIQANEPKEFALALQRHEIEMSNVLESQTVKEALFEDFDGIIKSLGAWGGDFVLVISKQNPVEYFNHKGYNTVLSYQELILA
jgi:mevalonate kinase